MKKEHKRILEHARRIIRLFKRIRESDLKNLSYAISIGRQAEKIKRDLFLLEKYE